MIGIFSRVGAAVITSIVPPAVGDQVRVESGQWQSAAGGEFKITALSGFAGANGMASDEGAGSFQSFCLEFGSPIQTGPGSGPTPANEYNFVMGTAAVPGGSPGPSDTISFETAYLYTQFRTGALSEYVYAGDPADRKLTAGALQEAIWFLEGEVAGLSSQLAADWVAEAQAAVAGTGWGATLGNVRVLVLTRAGNEFQDVLTLIPLPAAGWIGLAGLAAIPVIHARRRAPRG